MKTVYFNVVCQATYKGKLEVPDDTKEGDLLDIINEQLDEVPVGDLEWVGGDTVEADDIQNYRDFEEVA